MADIPAFPISGITLVLLAIVIGFLSSLAIFRGRFPRVFEAVSVVFLNTLIALLALELAATGILRTMPSRAAGTDPRPLPGAAAQGFDEHSVAGHTAYAYSPYVGWQARPIESAMFNVGPDRNRVTPGADPDGDFRVFMFGGSTMWGFRAPDSATIAAYLQLELDSLSGTSIEVVNFGQVGWVSTQSLVKLALELQRGNVPDLVIFYDGINDAACSYIRGWNGVHYILPEVRSRLEGTDVEPPVGLADLVRATNLYALVSRVLRASSSAGSRTPVTVPELLQPMEDSLPPDSLARMVVDGYLSNYDMVEALSGYYGFRHIFFWQPVVFCGDKVLTAEESVILADQPPAFAAFCRVVWDLMEDREQSRQHLVYLGDAFDSVEEGIFLDDCHLTADGNRRIARLMVQAMRDQDAMPGPGGQP